MGQVSLNFMSFVLADNHRDCANRNGRKHKSKVCPPILAVGAENICYEFANGKGIWRLRGA